MRKFVLFAYKVKTFFAMLYAKVHNLPHWRMESPASVLVFKAAAAQEPLSKDVGGISLSCTGVKYLMNFMRR